MSKKRPLYPGGATIVKDFVRPIQLTVFERRLMNRRQAVQRLGSTSRRILSRGRWFCRRLFCMGVGLVFRIQSDTTSEVVTDARRILVVRLDGIGDLILSTPVLRELRKARPECEITLLIPERARALYETCPYVDKLLTIDRTPKNRSKPLQCLLAARAYWRTREKPNFDVALSPRLETNPYLAFVMYFSGAPIRIGYSERLTRINLGLDRFLTRPIPDAKQQHETLNSLAVLRALKITPADSSLELWLLDSDRDFVASRLGQDARKTERLVVALGIGANARKRIWPVERQAMIATWLIEAYDARVVLLGDCNAEQAAATIAAQNGKYVVNLVGRTSLRQAAAVLEKCSILLSNDSGMLHIGSAMGTPTVEISCHPRTGSPLHSNAPERFGPWRVRRTCVNRIRTINRVTLENAPSVLPRKGETGNWRSLFSADDERFLMAAIENYGLETDNVLFRGLNSSIG